MELQDYVIKNDTKCKCAHVFTIRDMKKLQRLSTPIYGGAVKHVDEIQCPECGRDTLLLIKQQGQTYIVKDIAQKPDDNIKNTTHFSNDNIEEVTQFSNESDENHEMCIIEELPNGNTENDIIENKVSNEASNEIICSICGRSFKNKSGLTVHMKTHAK